MLYCTDVIIILFYLTSYIVHISCIHSFLLTSKDLCRTRWIECIDALDRFHTLHESIVECFQIICSEGRAEWSQDSITDAVTLKSAITTTEFISSLSYCFKIDDVSPWANSQFTS